MVLSIIIREGGDVDGLVSLLNCWGKSMDEYLGQCGYRSVTLSQAI